LELVANFHRSSFIIVRVTVRNSDLINARFGPLCGRKSDISRGPRSARKRHMHHYLITSSAIGVEAVVIGSGLANDQTGSGSVIC
jgi:hypothetical protein